MRSGLELRQSDSTSWTNGFKYDGAHPLATVLRYSLRKSVVMPRSSQCSSATLRARSGRGRPA